jgi:replicative DNA helicase
MTRSPSLGFRIVGSTATRRRLVDAAAAFAGYASCDPKADLDRESYLSAFRFGADFRDYLNTTRSTKGFDGSCWTPFVWFDLDDADDTGRALASARRLAAFILARYTDLDDDALLLFFSGSKGFHVGLPLCWDAAPSPIFHRVTRRLAEGLATGAGVRIDSSVYDKVRAFRAPNSTHPKTGLHKRRLTHDELNGLTLDRIRQLAEHPEPFDLPAPTASSEQAAADWRDAMSAVQKEAEGKAERRAAALNGTPTLNRMTAAIIRGEVDPERRAVDLFSAAANIGEFPTVEQVAFALLREPGLDAGLPPKEVERQIRSGLDHAAKQRGASAMNEAHFRTAADLFAGWRDDVLSGTPPTLYPIGTGDLARVEIGPGLVALIGGAPGAGKTAFTMQAVVDALRLTPDLRAIVCNVEMLPAVLLDRQLARLSGVDASLIRYRRLDASHADRIDQALATLDALADRLAFVSPPFDLANVAATADALDAGLIVLDYIQRIPPPGDHADKRTGVNATMDYLRKFADAGTAVVVVSAVGRTKDSKGRSSYSGEGLNLASFRESSELEFGCDDAFILTPDGDDGDAVTLRHLKSRHGEARDIALTFDRKRQRFEPSVEPTTKADDAAKRSALAALWKRKEPDRDDAVGGNDA